MDESVSLGDTCDIIFINKSDGNKCSNDTLLFGDDDLILQVPVALSGNDCGIV